MEWILGDFPTKPNAASVGHFCLVICNQKARTELRNPSNGGWFSHRSQTVGVSREGKREMKLLILGLLLVAALTVHAQTLRRSGSAIDN